jgi:ribosome-associated protein
MIRITDTIWIDERSVQMEFVRAAGPGGQNVNKVSTAVQLRLDVNAARLPEDMRRRLARLAGSRLTAGGELIIGAREFRSQERNRQEAFRRLIELLRLAAKPPKPRRPSRPTHASRQRRLERKRHRRQIKRLRQSPPTDD